MAKDPFWKDAYDKAQQQLKELRDSRDEQLADLEELNQEIIQLEALIQHVAPFVADSAPVVVIAEGIAEMRLADACREVLKQSNQFRTPRGVRDSLEASGYDLNQHNNALASIHGVLKRFAQTPDVEEVETGGKSRYRWKDRGVTGSVKLRGGFAERFMQGQKRSGVPTEEEARVQSERKRQFERLKVPEEPKS